MADLTFESGLIQGTVPQGEEAQCAIVSALTAALKTRVVSLSLMLGRECRFDEARMRSLELGSLLHDIGKIGVPDHILRKPARLTIEEWAVMRQHTQHGE